jgi:methyl-accepting chemotaxis protein
MPDHHGCRLGKWYDAISNPEFRALPAYAGLVDPHRRVHAAGKAALAAHAAGKSDEAFVALDQLNEASLEVLDLLEQLSVGIGDIERGAERRGATREPVSIAAEMEIGNEKRQVTVMDISDGGARIKGLRPDEVGSALRLRMADGRCCAGHATWIDGSQGGIRFQALAAE